VFRLDAVERRERAAEDVVKASELACPLDRQQIDGLLDDADQGVVTARVQADRADLVLGQVAALPAEADAFRWRRWKASRCAVREPIPGRRESCATRLSTAGLSTCPILPTRVGLPGPTAGGSQ
jgi:hypothetical protein